MRSLPCCCRCCCCVVATAAAAVVVVVVVVVACTAQLACSICIAVGCRPLNRVDPTGALPRGDPNVTARLLAALAASSLVHAVRLALADDSDGSDEARMVVVLDGAMAAASFAGFVVESMRWSRIACRRADALESHLAARTDGAGHKVRVSRACSLVQITLSKGAGLSCPASD
nr:hypothetical protein HK105_007558 [Polyrhizophydium stewartii]